MAKINKSLLELYNSLNDKPIGEQRTYGDLSDKEWEAERETMGMKTDNEGNQYIDFKYDPGNEPLEIQMLPDQGEYANMIFYIEPEDIEAYVNGEDVEAIRPDAGHGEPDEITANRNNSDVVGVSEDELEDFIASSRGDQSTDDVDDDNMFGDDLFEESPISRYDKRPWWKKLLGMTEGEFNQMLEAGCSEQQIMEGTCGYGVDGEVGDKPAGPYLMRELDKPDCPERFWCSKDSDCDGFDDANCGQHECHGGCCTKMCSPDPGSKPVFGYGNDAEVGFDGDYEPPNIKQFKGKLMERFQKLAGIKPLYEAPKQMLNEMEACDPDAGAGDELSCPEGETCTYISSAMQYRCQPNDSAHRGDKKMKFIKKNMKSKGFE
tara:strand:+ start:853 stop:1983 length:1131 start_codon:yes stop_codon:yes gene_type:complete